MIAATDFLGREIKAGDTIAYPVRRGSSMWMNKLRITQVTPTAVTGLNAEGRWVTVRNLKNAVVVTELLPAPTM
jgi:hypothetical protein